MIQSVETETALFNEKLSSLEGTDRQRVLDFVSSADIKQTGAACVLLDLGLDADTIIASLVLENFKDGRMPDGIADSDTAVLVQGVKKIEGIKTDINTSTEAQNIRNVLFVLTDDLRAILIKLAEKLHALQKLDFAGAQGQKEAARECIDIYAPVADQLGISWLKDEMEDLCLKFLNRETYSQIKSIVAQKREQRSRFLEAAQKTIKDEAEKAGFTVEVKSRAKHFYSVYMKMRKRGKPADKIRDLSGVRIICDTMENCYTLLGIIHGLWKPMDGSFKDYIARPKPNGYRSLHTSVLITLTQEAQNEDESEGQLLEIQIRTKEMHRIAEYGVASHWLYKQGGPSSATAGNSGMVNRLRSWKQDGANNASHLRLEEIKNELLSKWVYAFTPQGNVVKLPAGATPVDFAYHVHTAVGEHCIGAKAYGLGESGGGSIIPLSSPLKNAQTVEILTSPQARPTLNWLEVAKSSKTRAKIKSWLEKNDESLRAYFASEKPAGDKKKTVTETTATEKEPSADQASAVQRVTGSLSSVMRVRIEDEKNLMIRFAGCCHPVTGDEIAGYVSRGRGIIIHRKNCPNLAANPESENRIIDARWENAASLVKRFRVEAKFSANLFSEIEGAIRKRQGHLLEGRLEETGDNTIGGIFTVQLTGADDLKAVIKSIRGIPWITGIQQIETG